MPTQAASHASDLVLVAVMPNQRDLEIARVLGWYRIPLKSCLLYTSDAADDLLCVDLGGRRIIKTKKKTQKYDY